MELKSAISSVFLHAGKHLNLSPNQRCQPVPFLLMGNRDDIDPLYKYLTSGEANADVSGDIKWNFNKFLIDKNGKVLSRFDSGVEPDSKEISVVIESAL